MGKRKDGKKKRHWRITKALKEESLVSVNKTKDVELNFEATSPSFTVFSNLQLKLRWLFALLSQSCENDG